MKIKIELLFKQFVQRNQSLQEPSDPNMIWKSNVFHTRDMQLNTFSSAVNREDFILQRLQIISFRIILWSQSLLGLHLHLDYTRRAVQSQMMHFRECLFATSSRTSVVQKNVEGRFVVTLQKMFVKYDTWHDFELASVWIDTDPFLGLGDLIL